MFSTEKKCIIIDSAFTSTQILQLPKTIVLIETYTANETKLVVKYFLYVHVYKL